MTTVDWELPTSSLATGAGTFADACRASEDHLVYFLLNVGDGDTQLLLLPAGHADKRRRAMVVDVATVGKLPALLDALAAEDILHTEAERLFPLVIGTHPHSDHLGGMAQFLRRYGGQIEQYWEPGYYHPSGAYVETMVALEDHPGIRHLQPTSGTTCYIQQAKVTVLTPGIGLRNRFDSYGVAINDASISIKVEFPASRVAEEPAEGNNSNRTYLKLDAPWSLLLGADAQTTAWSQATVDFPELHRHHNPALYRSLRQAVGSDRLQSHILKVPHHASKRGINLELMERIKPRVTLISSVAGGGRYNFPHPLAVEAIREAIQPIGTTSGARTSADHELGIHHTGARTRGTSRHPSAPLGSIAVLVPPRRGVQLQVWRLGDGPGQRIDLADARRVKQARGAPR
jgi:beta-lactamase superfamily II metal-dependent hydrolase